MKLNILKLAAVAVLLSLSVVGCRKGLDKTTPLPKLQPGAITSEPPGPPVNPNLDNGNTVKPGDTGTTPTPLPTPPGLNSGTGIPLSGKLGDYVPSADQPFKADTLYFEFDKSTVKPSEVPKVEKVASAFKGMTGKALRIEGHCDERGTEEYNRSLGERRALAVREALVRAGVDANQIDTISYGEDRPVDPGHNESAWKKNRRGEFIVIEPPGGATTGR